MYKKHRLFVAHNTNLIKNSLTLPIPHTIQLTYIHSMPLYKSASSKSTVFEQSFYYDFESTLLVMTFFAFLQLDLNYILF